MLKTRALFLALLTATSAANATAQQEGTIPTLTSPLHALTANELDGVVTLRFDRAVQEELAAGGELLRLTDFVLPEGPTVDVVLRSVSAMEAGGTAVVMSTKGVVRVAPSVSMYSGHVEGRASAVFLAASATQLNGYVTLDGELYLISTGGKATNGTAGKATNGTATIAHASVFDDLLPGNEWCKVARRLTQVEPTPRGEQAGSGPSVRIGDYFIEADHQFRALFASDQDCIDYVVTLLTANSEIYRRDLGVVTTIPNGYIRIWNDMVPPWGVITTFSDIQNVVAWWTSASNPDIDLPRATVHVFTHPVFGGVAASIGGACNNSIGYQISSLSGSFPYPIQHQSSQNVDLYILTHEYGHTHGSPHTFDYVPEITCVDGSGPDQGTIMSYCHLNQGGVANVGMRFHPRVQVRMRSYLNMASCLTTVPILPGDYDYDGDRDLADLSVLGQCIAQGFTSEGCRETFDFDGDGLVDEFDRQYLIAIINGNPPASTTFRNGTGVNSSCYSTVTQPILGKTWTSEVDASSHSGALFSWILGYPLPATIPLGIGEVLVDVTSGQILFSVAGTGPGVHTHDNAIPKDIALSGYLMSTQAVVTGGFIELCNALDLVLEFF